MDKPVLLSSDEDTPEGVTLRGRWALVTWLDKSHVWPRRGWEEMEEKHILPLSSGNFWCPTGSSHWPTTTGSQSTRESEEAVPKGETPRKINNIEDRQCVDMGSK